MISGSVGQMLVNQQLPEDMRDYTRVLDKKGLHALLGDLARRYPEKYREISHNLSDIGWRAAQESGGFSFGMQHLQKSPAAVTIRNQLQQQIQSVLDSDAQSDEQRDNEILKLTTAQIKPQQDAVYKEALNANNPLALAAKSGARGSPVNLNSLLGADLLYMDHRDHTIPYPVLHSYSEGLMPAEYFAGSFGARKGVIDLKAATAQAGFLGKQLNQINHRLLIEDLDGVPPAPDSPRGMPADVSDPDNEGALLATDTGPYKRNTVLTPSVLRHLQQLKNDRILVRSPTVGGPKGGGLYSRDVGVREHGNLPGRGEFPGMAAAQALSEPLTQGMISSKHSGGIAGEGKSISGFKAINALVNPPEHFEGGAAHSEQDGMIGRVADAPTGGKYLYINGQEHYVPAGAALKVKSGDTVEAGDVLSDGLPNVAKVVKHKGIGEGRRYFVEAFREANRVAGLNAHRRNVELLSRGLINHVRLTEEMGDYAPDDVVPYHTVEHSYRRRAGTEEKHPAAARNWYLEKPVLHYSVGTKIRPSVIKTLGQFGVKQVAVHRDPPPFEPEMLRGMDSLTVDPDWQTRQYGFGLKGGLLKAVSRGAVSDEAGTSFVPSLAGSVGFASTPGHKVHAPDPGWDVKTSAVRVETPQEQSSHLVDLNLLRPNRSTRYNFAPVNGYAKADTTQPVSLDADLNILDLDSRHRVARLKDQGAAYAPVRRE
jgi:hypothetical protein